MNFFDKYVRSGKTIPFLHYMGGILSLLVPRLFFRIRRHQLLRNWQSRADADYIRDRRDYYCALDRRFEPEADALPLADIRLGKVHSRYAIDAQRILRCFPASRRINFMAGDIWENPAVPTVIRGRRLSGGWRNAVILNMDSARHFLRPKDNIPFCEKCDKLFFRGYIHGKPRRVQFFEKWAAHPGFDLGDTDRGHLSRWHKPPVTIPDHFRYKFILTLEGNDVASALQWVMASNCVPVMPAPTAEGWLMHGRLLPGVHYIEIASDFSDVGEKMEYYISHPGEAEKIAMESKKWAAQFFDRKRERIISLLVAQKYLEFDDDSPREMPDKKGDDR